MFTASSPHDDSIPLGSLPALQSGLASGRWSPLDVIEAVLARLEAAGALQGNDPAVIDVRPRDELVAEARQLAGEGASGRPLWGVPFAVKGTLDVRGLPTTAACPGLRETLATRHSAAVQCLVDAGAVVVCTTNLDQFATGLVGTRTPYGACSAVGHPGFISGGSSSGSAVIVARGDLPFAVATDTAGSGRVPAALNGIIGYKPSRGLVSTRGLMPACRSLDCVSFMTRTTADAALVAHQAFALDPDDPWSRAAPPPFVPEPDRRWRIGVVTDEASRALDDAATRRAYDDVLDRLVGSGAILVPVDFRPFLAVGALLYGGTFVAERYGALGRYIEARPEGLDPTVASIIMAARDLPAYRVFDDQHEVRVLAGRARAVWPNIDALALPTTPTTFTHQEVAEDPLGTNHRLGHYTTFGNLLDLCAVVIPAGKRSDGHPFGLQLLGPALGDERLLALAQDLEPHVGPEAPRYSSFLGLF